MSSSDTSRQYSSSQSSRNSHRPHDHVDQHTRTPQAPHYSTSHRSSTSATSSYYPGESRSSHWPTHNDQHSYVGSASHQSSSHASHAQEDRSAYSCRPQPSNHHSEQLPTPRNDNRSSQTAHPSSAMGSMERYIDSPESHSRYQNEHHRSSDPYHAIGYYNGRWQYANRGYDAPVSSNGTRTGQQRR